MNIWVINANIEKILELYWKGYSFYEALEIVKGGEELEEEWNVEKTHKSYSFLQRKCRTWE